MARADRADGAKGTGASAGLAFAEEGHRTCPLRHGPRRLYRTWGSCSTGPRTPNLLQQPSTTDHRQPTPRVARVAGTGPRQNGVVPGSRLSPRPFQKGSQAFPVVAPSPGTFAGRVYANVQVSCSQVARAAADGGTAVPTGRSRYGQDRGVARGKGRYPDITLRKPRHLLLHVTRRPAESVGGSARGTGRGLLPPGQPSARQRTRRPSRPSGRSPSTIASTAKLSRVATGPDTKRAAHQPARAPKRRAAATHFTSGSLACASTAWRTIPRAYRQSLVIRDAAAASQVHPVITPAADAAGVRSPRCC